MRALRLCGATIVAVLTFPATSTASPWTLKKGTGVLYSGFTVQAAGQEFLDGGGAQVFPLDGQYTATSLSVGGRIGVTDRFEFAFSLPFSVVSYQADPVILLEPSNPPAQSSTLDFFQENVINLSQTRAGVGDVRLAGRYRLASGPLVTTIEAGFKIPTGYDAPAGTFGEQPTSQSEFLADVTRFVDPDNVRDDVTLGDGQVDFHVSLLLGYALRAGTFFRLNAGYKLRLDGAADQVTGLLRIGQAFGRRVLAYVGGRFAYSVEDGRVIGVSVSAIDPALPATEYGGVDNLLLRPVQLRRDNVDVGGGLIIRLTERLEFNAGYDYTVWGRNTAAIHAASISLALRVDIF